MIAQVVEDQPLMLRSLVNALKKGDWFEEILLDQDGTNALQNFIAREPQLLVLDIELPKMSGLQVAQSISLSGYSPKIVLITGYANEATICGVSRLKNIQGFLFKSDNFFDELRTCIERILHGKLYFCTKYTKLLTDLIISGNRTDSILSFKERRILGLIGAGWPDDRIACSLLLSESTVRYHTQRIRSKLGVHSNRDLMKFAYKLGFAGTNWDDIDLVDHFDIP